MFFNLITSYATKFYGIDHLNYALLRAVMAFILSIILSIICGQYFIDFLRKWQKNGQPIREDGPQSHFSKAGTPTMGGLMLIFVAIISTLLSVDLSNLTIWACIFSIVAFAALGFIDDYEKVSKQSYRGITAHTKFALQILVGLSTYVLLVLSLPCCECKLGGYNITVPFWNKAFDIGYLYIPFAVTVMIGASNAVNLTDGLDGLAASTSMVAFTIFAIIAYFVGYNAYSSTIGSIEYCAGMEEVAVLCAAVAGSCLGFIWYNGYPAQLFMGDTGSLALGGLLGALGVLLHKELLLVIIGAVFVTETISVILQVSYFKYSGGKRIFLITPIHHHFEKKGLHETKVVVRFLIIAVLFGVLGLASCFIK